MTRRYDSRSSGGCFSAFVVPVGASIVVGVLLGGNVLGLVL